MPENTLHLKVKEALPNDVGRGIIRMDPADLTRLGVSVGDVVRVSAKKSTAAKVLPAYKEDRGLGVVRIDGTTRENAQAGIDEKVAIVPVECRDARRLVVTPLIRLRSFDSEYIGSLLEGIPVVRGDLVRTKLFGSKTRDFTVTSTKPGGVVIIKSSTRIDLGKTSEKPESGSSRVSYEDIGGLEEEIQRIREMIELPLKYPQVFERLGIDPPKGVLLHGPPGCGKTLIARAVANETDAYFTHLSGPEIMNKLYGQSEANLRKIFDEASQRAPSIIFLDEIDAIAPKREEMGGEKQVEKRVVAQLLALLDGLSSRGQVIVIGATNIPNSLDPALRRPGRFDREIEISVPDINARLEILKIHTQGMPLADDVNLNRLAEITHGYIGADLEALCREAAMGCLRTLFPSIDFEMEQIPTQTLLDLKVKMEDFHKAIKGIDPSAIREFFSELPNVPWDSVGGLEKAKKLLRETVEWPMKYAGLFELSKTPPAKGIIMSGVPGCGKTLLAKAIATESGVNFISVKGPELLSKWIGESEKGVRELFRKARLASPCILFFDEIDSLVSKRGGQGSSGVVDRVISQFLTEMDGVEELKDILVLAATNRMDMIDPALLRSGRFDYHISIDAPDTAARKAIFDIYTRQKPLEADVDLDALAQQTREMTGSDIELICKTAALNAIRDYIGVHREPDETGAYAGFRVSAAHFDAAVLECRNR